MKLTSTGVADQDDFLLLEELEKKLLVKPQDYETLLRKALLLHYPFLSTDQAEEVFEFIEKIYPNTYETIFWHGTMLFIYVAYYEKAIELLRKAVGIDPQRAEAYILLAQALEEGGQDEGVEFLYKKASLIKPEWPNAWDGLINLFIKQKRFKEARHAVQEALIHAPLDYVHSDDIIQGRIDKLVSGRSRTCHVKQDLQRFLEIIEAEETKELEVKKTI